MEHKDLTQEEIIQKGIIQKRIDREQERISPKIISQTKVVQEAPECSNPINRSILDFDDSGRQRVDVPEWEGHVYVRRMSSRERLEIIKSMPSGDIPKDFQEGVVIMACVDSQGIQIFQLEDKQRLATKSATSIERIFKVIARLNGLTSDSVQQLAGE